MTGADKYDNILRNCMMLQFHFYWGCAFIGVGLLALIARIPTEKIQKVLRPWHATLGSLWFYGVLIQMGSSLYCRDRGLSFPIFTFLMICAASMVIGHLSIRGYQIYTQPRAFKFRSRSDVELAAKLQDGASTSHEFAGTTDLATETRILGMPVLYLKYVHGISMAVCYSMFLLVGVMFTLRSRNLGGGCQSFYADHEAGLAPGNVVINCPGELAGSLCYGGVNATPGGEL